MKAQDLTEEALAIETEILQEKAATLARIANTLSAHLDKLYSERDSVLTGPPEERPERVRRFHELRDLVRTWHWYLIVQREANGLRHHGALARHYPIPSLPEGRCRDLSR